MYVIFDFNNELVLATEDGKVAKAVYDKYVKWDGEIPTLYLYGPYDKPCREMSELAEMLTVFNLVKFYGIYLCDDETIKTITEEVTSIYLWWDNGWKKSSTYDGPGGKFRYFIDKDYMTSKAYHFLFYAENKEAAKTRIMELAKKVEKYFDS